MNERALVRSAMSTAAAHAKAGRHHDAVQTLNDCLAHMPGNNALRYRLSEALVAADRSPEAIEQLSLVVNADAKQIQPMRLLGALLYREGRFDASAGVYQRLIAMRPKDVESIDALAKCQLALGHPLQAIALLEEVRERGMIDCKLDLTLARAMFKLNRLDEACELLECESWSHHDRERLTLLAQVYERKRVYDKARSAAESAIQTQPDDDVAHRVIARIDRSQRRHQCSCDRLVSLLDADLSHESRAHVRMELGQVLDDMGEYDRAMAMFESGHQAFEAHNPALGGEMDSYIERLQGSLACDDDFKIASWSTTPPDDGLSSPVFLVGFPRSGTTLFEQIIGGLDGFTTSDEAPMLVESVNTHIRATPEIDPMIIQSYARGMDEDTVRMLRARYWELAESYVGEQCNGRSATLLDKHPMNTPLLPVTRRLFPDARIITVLRDPRDAVLSAYMQDMVPSRAMLHFRTLEVSARLYDAMMRLYRADRERLGLRIHEARYEDLVEEPEKTARQLVEFLGRAWSPTLLEFTQRSKLRQSGVNPYSTARAIFRSSHGRWRRYERYLSPIGDLLKDHIQNFGYSE